MFTKVEVCVKKELPVVEAELPTIIPILTKVATDMNWSIFLKALTAIPSIVNEIEVIHGQTVSGVSKQAMAQQALTALTGGVNSVLSSSNQAIATAASSLASSVIDNSVAAAKAQGTGAFASTVVAGAINTAIGVAQTIAVAQSVNQTPATTTTVVTSTPVATA